MEQWHRWEEKDARLYVAAPSTSDDKYSRGVLGVISGSTQYPGAAVLVCEGVMRTGVGMVRYLGPKRAQELVLIHRPEVVIQDGRVQAWVIGPGIDSASVSWRRELLMRRKLEEGLPTLLDAGGLTLIRQAKGPILITPHYRELAGLLSSRGAKVHESDIRNDPMKWARFASDSLRATVLLKGNRTFVVSQSRQIELPPAPSWLAAAGTGDVLAGIIGGLLAIHSQEIAAQPEFVSALAATGAFIHLKAAEIASAGGPITAMAVANSIPKVVRDLLHTGI